MSGWSIDYYITAGDLSGEAEGEDIQGNIRQIERALTTTTDTSVFMLWDQAKDQAEDSKKNIKPSKSFATQGGTQAAWSTTGTATLVANSSPSSTVQSAFTLSPEQDTGTAQVLKDFIDSASQQIQKSPSTRNALFFSNHGKGILGGFNVDDIDNDNAPSESTLTVAELKSILAARVTLNPGYDLIAFDECLMATVEVAYELRQYTNFLVASEEVIPGSGYDYTKAFKGISSSTSPKAFAEKLVSAYTEVYAQDNTGRNTLSAINVKELDPLTTALKTFSDECLKIDPNQWKAIGEAARASTNYKTTYLHDLGQFLDKVSKISSLPQAVIDAAKAASNGLNVSVVAKTSGSGKAAISNGLSVVLPATTAELKEMTGEGVAFADFLQKYKTQAPEFLAATNWDKFLKAFLENAQISNANPTTSTAIAKADSSDSSKSKGKASSFLSVNDNLTSNTGDSKPAVKEYSLEALSKISSADLSFKLTPGFGSTGTVTLNLVRRSQGTSDQFLATISGDASTSLELQLPSGITLGSDTLLQVATTKELINNDVTFSVASGVPVNLSEGSTPSTAINLNSDTLLSGNFLTSQSLERWFKFTTARTVSDLPEEISLYSTDDGDFDLAIYDGNSDGSFSGNLITDSSGTGNVGAAFQTGADNTYYIKVSSTADQLVTSNLDFSLIASESAGSDGLPTTSGLTPGDQIGVEGLVSNASKLSVVFPFISLKDDSISDYGYYDPSNPTILNSWKTGSLGSKANGAIDRDIAYATNFTSNLQDFYSLFSGTEAKSVGFATTTNAFLNNGLQNFGIYVTKKDGTILRSEDLNSSITSAENDILAVLGDSAEVSINSGVFKPNVAADIIANIDLQLANVGLFTKELLTYQVDDITGGLVVNGRYIPPTDKDYARYAVERAANSPNKSLINSFSSTGANWTLGGGEQLYGTVILTNTDAASFLANNPTNQQNGANQNAWFSLGSANPDGLNHFVSLGNNTYGFEDAWGGGGNADYNDLVLHFTSSEIKLV